MYEFDLLSYQNWLHLLQGLCHCHFENIKLKTAKSKLDQIIRSVSATKAKMLCRSLAPCYSVNVRKHIFQSLIEKVFYIVSSHLMLILYFDILEAITSISWKD